MLNYNRLAVVLSKKENDSVHIVRQGEDVSESLYRDFYFHRKFLFAVYLTVFLLGRSVSIISLCNQRFYNLGISISGDLCNAVSVNQLTGRARERENREKF